MDLAGHELFALAVDLGTGGPKIGLVSLTGALAWSEHVPVVSHRGPGGAATQDAEQWWYLICSAAQRAVAAGVVPVSQIVAVSCTGQWASTVPVDANGLPVGDCLLWSDTRGADRVGQAVGGPVGGYAPIPLARWIRHNGGVPSLSGDDPIGHILFIEHDLPAVAAATRWYLEPVDYLAMRFTGVAAATPASMAGAWLTDNRHPDLLGYDPVLVGTSGVPAHKLPPLRPTGSIVGRVLPAVAARLGLPPGVAVIAGTPDLHSAAVGAGAVGAYQPHLAISTSSWISCPYPKKKTDPFRQMTTVVGATPGLNLVANNQNTAGGALEWLRGCLAEGIRTPSYEQLTGLAGQADPGSDGLIFTPWLAGERSPVDNRRARAGFHNLSLHTSRSQLVRAVMEGVAFNSRWLNQGVERFVGRKFGSMRAVGGGALSPLWCAIYAAVLGRPIEQVADPRQANLRGSGLWAGMALGYVDPTEIRSLVPVETTYYPDPDWCAVYDRLFAEFPKLYAAHRGMYRRLNRPAPTHVGPSAGPRP